MFQVVVGLVLLVSHGVVCSESDQWRFELADKYLEEFKSKADILQQAALNNQYTQFTEENGFDLQELTESNTATADEEYDFIIVGGGTSGSIIASRLSEVPEWKILLLEAGDKENDASKIPKYWELAQNSPLNWGYKTTPQNHSCRGMVDSQCALSTGRALGGSTTINSMVYTRGNSRDYDLWADQGNKGWCFADVLPFFKLAENAELENFDHKFHHQGGLQHIQNPQDLSLVAEQLLKAGKELEMETVDYNGKSQMGMGIPQLTTKCGRRYSTSCAYLDATKKRKNLIVKPSSEVIRVIISPHIKEAKGVQYIQNGKLQFAKVDKEVIVAAGALNTPKILILSGVGPQAEYQKYSIDQILDLKVGHNLRTRPIFLGLDFIEKEPSAVVVDQNQELLDYVKDGKGPLTSPGIEAIAFLKTEIAKGHAPYPDIELQFSNRIYTQYDSLRGLRLAPEQYDSLLKPLQGRRGINVAVILNHPKSTGYLSLNETNPLAHPIIEPLALSDPEQKDLQAILAGIRKVLKIAETESFQMLGLTINPNPVLGCEKFEFSSDEYWSCAIQYLVGLAGDVSGTCKMGPESDHDAVVDNYLRVHGIHNLRVADASVIPLSITGELAGPTIMIGEKAAHLIKKEWEA